MGFTDGIDAYCCAFEAYMNKDTIQDLREEINKMTALVNGFRKENDRLKEENAKLYLSNEELKRENKQLEKININLDNEISELEKEQDNLKQVYKIAIDENNFFIKENARLIEEIERVNSQCYKWGKDYETTFFDEEINKFKAENERLKKQIFIDKYNYVFTKARELKNEKLKFEEEIKKLKEESEKLRREGQEVYDDYCEVKEENEKLKEQVKYLTDSCNKLNDDYCKLKKAKEIKVYKEFDAEEFFKRFGANMEISLSPYTEPSITAYATDLNGVDLLRYSAEYTGRKFDDLFAPLYKYLASSPIERVVIAKELDKIRAAYNNLEAKHNADSEQISKYDEDLRDWKKQAILNAGNYIKAKNTITTLNIQIEKLKGGFKEKDKCIERLRSELQKYEKSKPNKKYPSFYAEDYYDNWWG